MKKLPTFFIALLLFSFSCGKEDPVTPETELNCYTCTTLYIEKTEPPTPGYPDTVLFTEEYCGNLEALERESVVTSEIDSVTLTFTTTVTCQ